MPLFPYKLHELLSEMEKNADLSSIISWTRSGNAFKIHEPLLFEAILLQKYFPRQTQINSFKRQLIYYGFDNLGNGIFAHPCFLKDRRHLCGQINHTVPTKSQREGKALISSRNTLGRRAKHALRQRLEVSPASIQATTTTTTTKKKEEAPRSSATGDPTLRHVMTSPTPLPPVPLPLQSSSSPPILARSALEMPNQFWSGGHMNTSSYTPPATMIPLRLFSMNQPKANQNLSLSTQGSMFPRMSHQVSGNGGGGFFSQLDDGLLVTMLLQQQPAGVSGGGGGGGGGGGRTTSGIVALTNGGRVTPTAVATGAAYPDPITMSSLFDDHDDTPAAIVPQHPMATAWSQRVYGR
ncbi:unnamed protein product [Cylindrotheca closterium]|uniref:HSF-type DNA-binding domain-containing protein n=1 Tax=Cylindrotheca closterium TaxID=2856 RepID=A0AAD2G832_9STRA|nr:unnamed protein product [Cylindrotheca closterium]